MKKIIFALAILASVASQAAILTFEAGPQQINGVVLNKTAAINDAKGAPTPVKMDLLGAGLRTKTVLVVEAKVYVAQLFSDNKAGYSRDANALASLVSTSNRVALKIDMLRTVSSAALSASFKDALVANGYTIDAELSNMLASIEKSAEATSGKSITMYMAKDAGKTNLYYQDTAGAVQSFTGSAQLMTKILSIWLGTPADSGLANLKTQLLKAVY
jgi:hypothetical protein